MSYVVTNNRLSQEITVYESPPKTANGDLRAEVRLASSPEEPRTAEQRSDSTGETYTVIDAITVPEGRRSPGRSPRRIVLNVGGQRHETNISTLQRYPDSRLGRLADSHAELTEESSDEYFYDRHPGVFASIIDFYRTGELHCPMDVCGSVIRRELRFWDVDEGNFESCCVTHFSGFTDNKRTLEDLRKSLEQKENPFGVIPPIDGLAGARYTLWTILNKPRASLYSMVYAGISFGVIGVSIVGYCMETLPKYQLVRNATCIDGNGSRTKMIRLRFEFLQWLDVACTIFFLGELFLKFICSPQKRKFMKSIMTVIETVALIPSFAEIILTYAWWACIMQYHYIFNALLILRMLRIFRVFQLLRHYGPFRVLLYSVKTAMNALIMLIVFLGVSVMFFGSLIYHAERVGSGDAVIRDEQDHDVHRHQFKDLTVGFWWSIITLTTVGYGDKAPSTGVGYVIGAVVAVSGLVILSLIVPIISNSFTLLYNFDVSMKNVHTNSLVQRRRKTLSANNSAAFRTLKRQSMRRLKKKHSRAISESNESQDSDCEDSVFCALPGIEDYHPKESTI